MAAPVYRKRTIGHLANEVDGAAMNTLCILGDVNADGYLDVVVSGRNGTMAWFEHPGGERPWEAAWRRHEIAPIQNLECGGLVQALTASGYPDVINGGDYRSDELSWWENPGPAGGEWMRRVIARTGQTQFHDELIADLDGDGRLSLIFGNQGGGALYCVPLPADPRVSPWPGLEQISSERREAGLPEEGLALADLDGDGRPELVAGTHWYRRGPGGWEAHRFASGYITTRVAVGDLDGDGRPEIVLAEGDACIYGRPEGGRLSYFRAGPDLRAPWQEHVLAERLADPHSLQLGDLCGHGRLDLLVGEIGVRETYTQRPPRLMIFENDGRAGFTPQVIDAGTGAHNAWLADLRGHGAVDIVTRPLHGPERWEIHAYFREGA